MNRLFSCITKDVQIFPLSQSLAISALISLKSFYLRSLDIFKCDVLHNMDFEQFSQWIQSTFQTVRREDGKNARIVITIDNAIWHDRLISHQNNHGESLSWWNG